MKIGVVTVQDSNNFGSFLQAYALQNVLQGMGHEVYFIRSRSQEYIKSIFYASRPGKHDLLHIPSFITRNWAGRKKYNRFRKEQGCFQVLDNYQDGQLDLVILGSDEIWNVQTATFRKRIFYGEGMKPVMAYAVSIGNSSIEDMKCIPEDLFCRIQPILARDNHTAEFLETLNITAPVVCDPTFLVDPAIFRRAYNSHLLNGQPFLLIYSYGLDQVVVDGIRSFANEHHLRILSACFPFDWCDATFDCTALDFCAVMEQASYVFTSTYHGTIFSIINHKKFVSLPQSRKTSDLLLAFELGDRIVAEKECTADFLNNKLLEPIDFEAVDRRIEISRKTSLDLLERGISQYGS